MVSLYDIYAVGQHSTQDQQRQNTDYFITYHFITYILYSYSMLHTYEFNSYPQV